MPAAGLLRLDTADRDATKHPAPAAFWRCQRSRRIRHSRRPLPLHEAVRRPALAFGSRRTYGPVLLVFCAEQPKSRAGSRFSL